MGNKSIEYRGRSICENMTSFEALGVHSPVSFVSFEALGVHSPRSDGYKTVIMGAIGHTTPTPLISYSSWFNLWQGGQHIPRVLEDLLMPRHDHATGSTLKLQVCIAQGTTGANM